MVTVGERIRQARRAKINPATGRRYSQADAADAIGTARSHWNRIERGVHKPEKHAAAIAEFLDMPLDDLNGDRVAA